MASGRLMMVEDDIPLATALAEVLVREGFEVELHHRGDTALAAILKADPDLVILDVMLPGADGFDILRGLRPAFERPVLMLTAREDAFDQVSGLELGADDYVVKPVLPRVLIARVKALLRRAKGPRVESVVQHFGELSIHPGSREARVNGETLDLTGSEYDLLVFMAENAGKVLEREDLFQGLRGIAYDGLDRSMDLRVSKLRSQIRAKLRGRNPIRTVHGRGYLFAVDT